MSRILVVDDDPEIRSTLKKLLEIPGHQVVVAADGRAAEAALAGEVGKVEAPLQSVVLNTNESPVGFQKQRLFAVYLLSRALMEQSTTTGSDWLSPSMRSLSYAAYGADWENAAKAEGNNAKSGQALLPQQLAQFGFLNPLGGGFRGNPAPVALIRFGVLIR